MSALPALACAAPASSGAGASSGATASSTAVRELAVDSDAPAFFQPPDFHALLADFDAAAWSADQTALLHSADSEEPDTDSTQPTTDDGATLDLQAAIAAMSALPWPAATPAVTAHVSDTAEACDTGSAGARDAILSVTGATTAPESAASSALTLLPERFKSAATPLGRADLPTDRSRLSTNADSEAAAPGIFEARAKAIELAPRPDAQWGSQRDSNAPETDARNTALIAELRSGFKAVLDTTARVSSAERVIATPVHDQHWPQAVANEVKWCAQNGVQSATLRLTPENLGPVELHVDLRDNQVNVSFAAAHTDTRAAIENSLPRLREMLASSGLNLGQANVQQESRRESQFSTDLRSREHQDLGSEPSPVIRARLHLIDEYA